MASSSSSPSATTLKSISESLNLIDSKKANLKKAFDELQSHSSLLTNFSLSWSDLESHFSTVQLTLAGKFRDLEALSVSSSAPAPEITPESSPEPAARPEIVELCERMDGLGLRRYISETAKDRSAVRAELPSAVRRAPDAAAMVLRAMEGYYGGADNDLELSSLRRSCVLLLEVLMAVGASAGGETRESAAVLAVEWRKSMDSADEDKSLLEALGFLHLVAAFDLASEFESDEIVDCLVVVAKYRQAVGLCRKIGLIDKVEDLVQKLISKGKYILAVKFVFEFGLAEKFPPVPLLKSHVRESKKSAKRLINEGNNSLKSLNEATAKEMSALRSVVKVIEDRKLESEYPPELLTKRIEELEKQRLERKKSAPPNHSLPSSSSALPSKPSNQNGNSNNKRPRTDSHSGPKPGRKSFRTSNPSHHNHHSHNHRQFQQPQPRFHRSGLAPGPTQPIGPYLMSGIGPSTEGMYTLPGMAAPPNNYYDVRNSYPGYNLQQYPPSYYPQ